MSHFGPDDWTRDPFSSSRVRLSLMLRVEGNQSISIVIPVEKMWRHLNWIQNV